MEQEVNGHTILSSRNGPGYQMGFFYSYYCDNAGCDIHEKEDKEAAIQAAEETACPAKAVVNYE